MGANRITSTGTFTIVDADGINDTYVTDLTVDVTLSGSNRSAERKNIYSASAWTPLVTGSLSDLKGIVGRNEGTASLHIAIGQGTTIVQTVPPGMPFLTWFSSSVAAGALYANCTQEFSSSASLLNYKVFEA